MPSIRKDFKSVGSLPFSFSYLFDIIDIIPSLREKQAHMNA